MQNLSNEWQAFFEKLPPMCSREVVEVESRIVTAGTLKNLDVRGTGIKNGRKVGRAICYPKADVVAWLMSYSGETVEGV